MADGYYFSNIWTQFERGFVAIASATAEVCLLVGPETANFVITHEADLPSRIVSLFQAWGAGYPNTAWEDAADVLTEMVGQSPRRIGIVGSGSLPVGLYQSLTDITPAYRRPERQRPGYARRQSRQRDRQYQKGVPDG